MRSFAKYTVLGISGVVAFKLVTALVLPLVGLVFGLVALLLKLAVVAAVVYFVWSLVSKKDEEHELDPDGEIVVEVVDEDDAGDDGSEDDDS